MQHLLERNGLVATVVESAHEPLLDAGVQGNDLIEVELVQLQKLGVLGGYHARGTRLDLSPEGIIALKESGVSDRVLVAATLVFLAWAFGLEVACLAEGRPLTYRVVPRLDFYERARSAYAVVHTLDTAPYGCFILHKGVIFDPTN